VAWSTLCGRGRGWLAGIVGVVSLGAGCIGPNPVYVSEGAESSSGGGETSDAHTTHMGPPLPMPWRFGEPVALLGLNGDDDDTSPTLTPDRLELIFASDRDDGFDLYRSTRASLGQPWTPPERIAELSSSADDASPRLSPDGLSIVFSSERSEDGNADIFVSTRDSPHAAWDPPVAVAELSGDDDERPCFISRDTRLLLFARREGFDYDLMLATRRASAQTYDAPAPIFTLNTGEDEKTAWLAEDRAMVVFTSDRDGDEDLWWSHGWSGMFAPPAPLDGINSGSDDRDPWLLRDVGELYFASDRGDGFDLYVATFESSGP